eukprot:353851-Chlamydomonas_euryale.AAC.15
MQKDVAVQNYPTLVFECLDGKQQSHVHIVPAGLDVMMDLQVWMPGSHALTQLRALAPLANQGLAFAACPR